MIQKTNINIKNNEENRNYFYETNTKSSDG